MPRLRLLLASAVAAAAFLAPATTAHAATTKTCASADLRYPFEPGGPKTFGVFRLKITGGSCTTAHRVAKAWMQRFEASLKQGKEVFPKTVLGFRFTRLQPTEAQTYRLRGRKGSTTIRLDYRVPNG